VGSAIRRKLEEKGYTNLLLSDLADFDLQRQQEVEEFFEKEKPEYVFLAAAKVGGIWANKTYPAEFIFSNIAIQTNVIHAAYKNDVQRLLFLGSSCIYPKLAPQPMKEEHLLTGLLEPTNEPYAIAKIAGIKMCEAYNRQYGTKFMAVMPTNLYGPNDNFNLENSHVLPALIRKFHLAKLAEIGDWNSIEKDEALFGPIPDDLKQSLLSGNNSQPSALNTHSSSLSTRDSVVSIWGTGSPRREILHVDDMADACVFVMNLNDQIAASQLLDTSKPSFFNVGSGTDCTIRELAKFVNDAVGFKGDIIFDPTHPDGTPRKLLDVSRLNNLGWAPSIGLIEGIQETYRWYTKQIQY
jgi:GDP-L-fucose synthase